MTARRQHSLRQVSDESDESIYGSDPFDEVEALLRRTDIEQIAATRLVDVAVVARRLAVSGTTVRNWILTHKLAAIKTPTGRYRVPVSELRRILKSL